MTPSERVFEIRDVLVKELAKRDAESAEAGTLDFMMRITGVTQGQVDEQRKKDPMVLILALLCYLD